MENVSQKCFKAYNIRTNSLAKSKCYAQIRNLYLSYVMKFYSEYDEIATLSDKYVEVHFASITCASLGSDGTVTVVIVRIYTLLSFNYVIRLL